MSADPSAERVPTWRVNRAVRASTLDAEATLIMLVLSDIADSATAELPPQRTPSTRQLARETRLSVSTVKRRRDLLETLGWIVTIRPTKEESIRHVRIKYRLAIPAGPHRTYEIQVAGFTQTPDESDTGVQAEPTSGFTVNPPEVSLWTPPGVQPDTSDPDRGFPGNPRGGSEGTPTGVQAEPPKEDDLYDHDDQGKKPPATAGDREQRLAEAEDLTDRFWSRWGSASAQRRPAVRAVIITAVADNAVPPITVAWALDALARAGQQITPDSLTKALARMRPAGQTGDDPPAPPPAPKPPPRYCQVYDHAHVELTPSGICRNCAADAKAAPDDEPDEPALVPAGRVPAPRHALSPGDTQTIPRTT